MTMNTDIKMKISFFVSLFLIFAGSLCLAGDFPAWMDEVDFSRSAAETSPPIGPTDPETGRVAEFERSSKQNYRPKLPDFSKLREKAIKATIERKASDSLSLQNTISFSEQNREKLQQSRDQLIQLLQTITDPIEKHKLTEEKNLIEQKLDAAARLLELINNEKGNISENISQLSESDFNQALKLQQLIFARPASMSKEKPKEKSAKPPQRNFHKPGKFKSFYLEEKEKAAREAAGPDENIYQDNN